MSDRVRTTVLPLLAAMIWGTAFVAQKGNTAGALTFNASRGVVAFIFLLIVILVVKRGDWKSLLCERQDQPGAPIDRKATKDLWVGGLCCGLALATATFLQQYGLDGVTEAGKAGFLTALYIVLVPLLGIFLKKRVPINVWLAVGIAVVGLYFLCVNGGLSFRPDDLIILAGSLVFAIHILIIDHFSPKCDGMKLSCIQFLVVSVISGAAAFVFEEPSWEAIAPCMGSVLYLGVFSSGVAYTLQIIAQRNANPTVLSLLLSMESVFSVISGALLLGEVLLPREYFGCAMMMAAVVLAQLPSRKRLEEGAAE